MVPCIHMQTTEAIYILVYTKVLRVPKTDFHFEVLAAPCFAVALAAWSDVTYAQKPI